MRDEASAERESSQGGIFSAGGAPPSIAGLAGRYGEPRQWAFPPAANARTQPRGTEAVTFEQLRGLAAMYDGIQLCERVYFDLAGRLELRVLPREGLADLPRWHDAARRIEGFLEAPDRTQDLPPGWWRCCVTCSRSMPRLYIHGAHARATSMRWSSSRARRFAR